jgi:hypothetical protein
MSECFKVTCAEDKKSYTVNTHTGTEPLDFLCDSVGKVSEGLDGYNFNFKCADPAIICAKITTCDEDCNFK